jgi:SpoVK/Ycf46/Vps4 family AAA+-type ATPase
LALLIDCDDIDTADKKAAHSVNQLLERIHGPVVVSARSSWQLVQRTTVTLEVQKPLALEQYDLWVNELNEVNGRSKKLIRSLVSQFNLSAGAIKSICSEARKYEIFKTEEKASKSRDVQKQERLQKLSTTEEQFDDRFWEICRLKTRPRLGSLAQSIKPFATWSDLVLPNIQITALQEIAIHVRQRLKVYEQWGFAAKSERGLGISALFSGTTGTGKTMAAEVLANELQLDLYRIDLSQVVSKYIGETEKNLARVFDEAEAGGAILLFDEADALFGKRSEVKDSHDRYANIEISYLLQRMEAYRGLAILTTNMKEAIDNAFLRRIRFVVHFPFPDAAMRTDIWRRIFPTKKITEGLDIDKLARLNIAGGNIRNISLNAAFLAADAGVKIKMAHILKATRAEYAKMEKPLSDAEIRDWDF